MNTEINQLNIGGLEINLQKKDIKNMYLGVYPPNGIIRLDVPHTTNEEVIRLFTISKIPWIRKQQKKFTEQEREAQREYVSGESHYLFGRQYRLRVLKDEQSNTVVAKNGKHLEIYVKKDSTKEQRKVLFEKWYRQELKSFAEKYVKKWEKITGIKVNECRIKKMKTKWGTSNKQAKRIWLNLELIKKSPDSIEYIIVHEMVHLLERKHNAKFNEYLSKFFPNWKQYKKELNKSLLGYAKWKY
ncbi:MAG: SprT family zinc-dependent metalloprotease [Candidatus Diapherotrites archaeon]|nr:SprT family zinc-dependent metalloprotease [Candidatus Diapherotrites archaeon]